MWPCWWLLVPNWLTTGQHRAWAKSAIYSECGRTGCHGHRTPLPRLPRPAALADRSRLFQFVHQSHHLRHHVAPVQKGARRREYSLHDASSTLPCIPPGSLNQARHPYCGNGENIASAGCQVTLRDPMWVRVALSRNVRRILVRGVNAPLPPEAKKILKIWLGMVHSEVYLNK